jgi:hypothetical protein
VLVQAPDESGNLAEVRNYDISSYQPSGAGSGLGTPLPAIFLISELTFDGCSKADEDLIRQRLNEALEGDGSNPGGLVCLFRLGAKAQMMAVIVAWLRPIDVFCDPKSSFIGHYDDSGWFDVTKRTELSINPVSFNKLTPYEQRHLLFHEMLHSYALHEYDLVVNPLENPRLLENDPIEACAETCWGYEGLSTKCSCATCLGTDVCDPRCAKFKACDPVLGFRCPCPSGPGYYRDCASCLVGCPSGLACFGMTTCTPISVECGGKKTTCP